MIHCKAAIFNMLPQICSGQGVAGVITSIADITTTLTFSDGKFFTLKLDLKVTISPNKINFSI